MSSLSLSVLQSPVLVLAFVAALSIAGAIVIELALRLRRRAFVARAALIAPWTAAGADSPGSASAPLQKTAHEVDLGRTERIVAWLLSKFGIPERFAPFAYVAVRPVTSIILSVGMWFLAPALLPFTGAFLVRAVLAAGTGVLGWFLPALAAGWWARRYRAAVVSGLPDALELLVICSEGGLSLADGIDRIVGELRGAQPELADELAQTAADLKILPSQDEALARFAQRVDAPIIRSVVTSLSQTLRYGTPLAQAMRGVAADLRNQALVQMEERVNRLPALLSIPMIVFILPTIILVSGGPAALKTIDLLTR